MKMTSSRLNPNRKQGPKSKKKGMGNPNFVLGLIGLICIAVSMNVFHFYAFGAGSIDAMFDHREAFKLDFGIKPVTTSILDEDSDDASKKKSENSLNGSSKSSSNNSSSNYRHESNIFRKIMERSASITQHCHDLPEHHKGEPTPKDFDTGVPPLPESGVHKAMKSWLEGTQERGDYPICYIPPSKSCDVDTFSVILMSHTVEDDVRLRTMRQGINAIANFKGTEEIILVWNADRKILEESEKKNAQVLVKWNKDESHPLRIFYSLENGLHNNLLNRYHPSVNPKSEAIVYFDDDGPFFNKDAMAAGFGLWRFNSDVQIGSMARNIRMPSKRMNDLQTETSKLTSKLYQEDAWQTHVHPYQHDEVEEKMKENGLSPTDDPGFPKFTPICNEQSGDVVEYNYFVFPHYKAHMSLPSGSLLHRNYLCFMWHPAFAELRQFILDHPTHPDDMTISTLVSHLSGKPLRTFPKNIKKPPKPEPVAEPAKEESRRRLASTSTQDLPQNQGRRRLLWQQKDWGNMREEAIQSIVRYFGSINSGSVGWCAGTEYEVEAKGKGNMVFNCNPENPHMELIPWLNAGGLGYDECPSLNEPAQKV